MSQAYGQLPLSFEANQGQADAAVNFVSRGSGYTLFLTPGEAVLALQKSDAALGALAQHGSRAGDVLRMQLVGGNAQAPATGLQGQAGTSNYLIGNDPSQWHTDITSYGRVEYQNVYAGVNLVYYGSQRQLEYDFVVAPSANPGVITLAFQGAQEMSLGAQGDLVLHTAGGDVVEHAPVLYQDIGGVRRAVVGSYVLQGGHQVGFSVGAYDRSKALVIDPVLSYSTYLGGSGSNYGYGIAVDGAGNAYVTGLTDATNFPTMNPLQAANRGLHLNAFVTKLSATGTALVYSTYLGGSGQDQANGIAVDGAGNAYVTGTTTSTDFPTKNPLQATTASSGPYGGSAFVAELNATGTALVYSTYLGGSGDDGANGIAVDRAGNAFVTGSTSSTDFPTKNPFQATYGGGSNDAFVAELNAAGSALIYSTYLGGGGTDSGVGIAVDSTGNAFVTGSTSSTNFPTQNPLQAANGGGYYDAFVTKLSATGKVLVYSTYLGGSNDDEGRGIAVDGTGNAYVTGYTNSSNFPTKNPLQAALGGRYDAFVTKLNATGTALAYSTYLGGSLNDKGYAIAVDALGNAYVVGTTSSSYKFPTKNPLQATIGGDADAFLAKLNVAGTALVYSTYFGGQGPDQANGIAVDALGNAYVTGTTRSRDFPTKNPFQAAETLGPDDAFVAKINFPGAFGLSTPSSVSAGTPLDVTLTATDASGNVAIGYTGTVHFTSSDALAVLPADYTFTAADRGVHTFSTTLKLAGRYSSIGVTDTVIVGVTGTRAGIVVKPAAASQLVVSAPASITAGVAFSITVTALDPYGNRATGYVGTAHFSSSDATATLPPDYAFTAGDNGSHTFTGLVLRKMGVQSLKVSDSRNSALFGNAVVDVL